MAAPLLRGVGARARHFVSNGIVNIVNSDIVDRGVT
jgi:hypothetical protein